MSAAVPGACRSLVSISSAPPGASHAGAPSATRACTSRPWAPPSRAIPGSWTRASGGIRSMAWVGTYGALQTSTSTRPRRAGGRASYRSPSKTRSGGRLRRAQATAAGSSSAAYTSTPGTSDATAAPTAPVPQHRSRTTDEDRARAAAERARNSVRRRGTNTPGATAIRSPQKLAQPTTTSSGRPAARSATIRSSSSADPAASASRPASSSANTHPAARSRSTRSGSGRTEGMGGAPDGGGPMIPRRRSPAPSRSPRRGPRVRT